MSLIREFDFIENSTNTLQNKTKMNSTEYALNFHIEKVKSVIFLLILAGWFTFMIRNNPHDYES